MQRLEASFYQRADTVAIARDLLGKVLVTEWDGIRTSGVIVETEAYLGAEDRACHAWDGRRTPRTEPMYAAGGIAYVYLCYGIHHLFNVVSHRAGEPHAILVRAVEPLEGVDEMLRRRGKAKVDRSLGGGPGALTAALGIKTVHTGLSLGAGSIWIGDRGLSVEREAVLASARVGVGYAGADAELPLRFRLRDSKWTSPAK